jgi:hypothetical protein
MDLDEVMDVLQTLIIGLGYHENSFKNWVIDRADEYRETDAEELKEKLDAWKFEDEDFFGQFEDWKNETPDDRYLATQEDEDEFSKDGGFDGKPHFEWGDEPEDDENLFEGDEWKANDKLKAANERYKSEVKKMKSKKRNTKD